MSSKHTTLTSCSATILLQIVLIFVSVAPASAECPPIGLVTLDDYFVAGGTQLSGYVSGGTVGIEECGNFIVAFTQRSDEFYSEEQIRLVRFIPNGTPLDSPSLAISEHSLAFEFHVQPHTQPSLAMSRDAQVQIAWISECQECRWPPPDCDPPPCQFPVNGVLMLQSDFPFDSPPAPKQVPIITSDTRTNYDPSAGRSLGTARVAWSNHDHSYCPPQLPEGTFHGPNRDAGTALETCDCGPLFGNCYRVYQPCIAVRSDGYYLVAWAEPEDPNLTQSTFNTKLRAFGPTGGPLGGELLVNATADEPPLSDQISPAVAIDDFGNVVVTWISFSLANCEFSPHVYARRFKFDPATGLRDPDTAAGEGPDGPFIVDSEPFNLHSPLNLNDANPGVALTMAPEHAGRFIVVWTSSGITGDVGSEIRGQYFESDGRPMGREFRVNVDNSPVGEAGTAVRRLDESARHTVVYGAQEQALVAWRGEGLAEFGTPYAEVRVTILPGGFAEAQDVIFPPLEKGDANGDGLVNGLDIQAFVSTLLDDVPLPRCLSQV